LIFIQHTLKYQQSLTNTLSLDEIRHRQLSSFCIHNRHQSFQAADRSLESMCSGSAEPSIRLAHVLAVQLLKFCGHAICCNARTLNNSQNLNLDFSGSEFLSSVNSGTWECRQMLNFRGNEDLCKLGQEYLNDLRCKFGPFCLQHSKTFDVSHAFLRVTIAELSTLKQVRVFLAHPVYCFYSVTMHNMGICNMGKEYNEGREKCQTDVIGCMGCWTLQ